MLLAVDFYLADAKEIVLVTPAGQPEDAGSWLAELGRAFVPNRILAVIPEDQAGLHGSILPLAAEKTAVNGRPTAYLCTNGRFGLPIHDLAEFSRLLKQ